VFTSTPLVYKYVYIYLHMQGKHVGTTTTLS
jgi:hypothetical protein